MINSTVQKLCGKMKDIADAALIFSDINILYYTGFPIQDSCLLVTEKEAFLYTDSRYTEAASDAIGAEFVVDSTGRMFGMLKDYFENNGIKTVAIEADRLTVAELDSLKKRIPDVEFISDGKLSSATNGLREIKTEVQLNKIIEAQRIAELAFDYICDFIEPGMTEKEVQLALDYFMLSNGADALSFETICVAGKKTSMPHGVPGDNIIKAGDFVTMDYGATVDGWHSDMTRTVAVGYATDKMKEIYNTVLAAQEASLSFLAPGKKCSDADAAARDVIKAAGYGEYFGHGTGHGVGVEIHEAPSVSTRSQSVLTPGHIVTVEPGIYIPGEFGVRIEDMAYITADGATDLTQCPKELIIL